ncbi:putative serine esterase-domain-containing protein [Mycena galopus ATCC 62051]|nr:putative serine esterase-domain-containing protein [Mycena galopus ATCC 62051]
MWGNPIHLTELNRIVKETIPDPSFHVLNAETNKDDSTYDGIDWGGERVAEEIEAEVEKLRLDGRTVTRFSITGYSMGGLLARYVVGILRQRGFFENVTPVNFNTIATPHIGLPRYPSFFSSLASVLGPKLLSRTGEQFYCVDRWSAKGRPLLEVMADPDRIFYQALAAFETIQIYANSVNDRTVPYVTAIVEVEDPFATRAINGLELEMDEQYDRIIKTYSVPPVPPPVTPKPTVLSPSWFKSLKPTRPFLPPFLQFRFPINIVMYVLLPVLVPVFISLALVRLSLATRSSRARIRLLENDASNSQKLVHILAQLEKQVENAVVDFIDDDAHAAGPVADPELALRKGKVPQEAPILTPTQIHIAAWLNRLPLKKQRAYFPDALNSHALIICRDVKRFEFHKQGESVVRHWADSFIL